MFTRSRDPALFNQIGTDPHSQVGAWPDGSSVAPVFLRRSYKGTPPATSRERASSAKCAPSARFSP